VFFSKRCVRTSAVGRPAKQGFAHACVRARCRGVASGAEACRSSRPDRASPRHAFVIALATLRAVRQRVGPGDQTGLHYARVRDGSRNVRRRRARCRSSRQTGLRPGVHSMSLPRRAERRARCGSAAKLVWRLAPRVCPTPRLPDTAAARHRGCAANPRMDPSLVVATAPNGRIHIRWYA
jgi:hypothetical protein